MASFGVTAYELAALGVPALYLCLTEDHAESAEAFVAAGMGRSLGVHGAGGEERILAEVEGLLADETGRASMAAAGRERIDGLGAPRVAHELAERVGRGGSVP